MTDILVTIRGTGTNYVMAQRDVIQLHCCSPGLEVAEVQNAPWITTYRDPYLVAATWVKRCEMAEIDATWYACWDYYATEVLPRAVEILRVEDFDGPVVKSHGSTPAREAYLAGDMETYFSIVPERMVNHALDLTTDLRAAA